MCMSIYIYISNAYTCAHMSAHIYTYTYWHNYIYTIMPTTCIYYVKVYIYLHHYIQAGWGVRNRRKKKNPRCEVFEAADSLAVSRQTVEQTAEMRRSDHKKL